MNPDDISQKLGFLRGEHCELNAAIDLIVTNGIIDQIGLARMKKRKLRLKDEILALEAQLIPDIIA
jgi:hypothetical protein